MTTLRVVDRYRNRLISPDNALSVSFNNPTADYAHNTAEAHLVPQDSICDAQIHALIERSVENSINILLGCVSLEIDLSNELSCQVSNVFQIQCGEPLSAPVSDVFEVGIKNCVDNPVADTLNVSIKNEAGSFVVETDYQPITEPWNLELRMYHQGAEVKSPFNYMSSDPIVISIKEK